MAEIIPLIPEPGFLKMVIGQNQFAIALVTVSQKNVIKPFLEAGVKRVFIH